MSETSNEERIADHFAEKANRELVEVEYDLKKLQEECERIYLESGSTLAKFYLDGLTNMVHKINLYKNFKGGSR